MLDLTQLARQMQGMSKHLTREAQAASDRLKAAQNLLTEAQKHQEELIESLNYWVDRIPFHPAIPIDQLDSCFTIQAPPAAHTVFATDGSQIAPNAHEIAYCYLINIGRVVLYYGQSRHPILDSVPEIFYRPEDLYISRQWGIRTEEWMGYQRSISEAIALAETAREIATIQGDNLNPALALVDGSLVYWFLETLPTEARDRIIEPILEAWDMIKVSGIPMMGYVSASRSSETISFLRLQGCPYNEPDCARNCPDFGQVDKKGKIKQAPCQISEPLRDTVLWSNYLKPGQRSPLWRSRSRILDYYDFDSIYFCYVNVGTEIARIECPAWVAENTEQFELALSIMLAQVYKGYGYPVALAEAHNQAVVRGGDRTRFFAMLEDQMIRAGLPNVGISYKEARKRGSIA
ncbi:MULTISPECIES: DNA double-strand break repair nuclease NurA [Oscillatoriales]|uniref:NurA domain-containing protein n=2 Tax=Limnospira TaxID=2596745 RepID=B5W222_LIMMA|nr:MULTISPECIES: DNA double-strand break repair nuclease NurA [Oscillatoriales]AMW26755.1 nuclease [Arthrospira platensis YZ]EKD09704.1 hypothetical protein SPLC1_S171530 [Arthrospira platensis C1]KDR59150.1 nuclease [Arthrospira platensis str. Paraca]MBD2667655.1 DNA double-strand break repair nuclease NurA [Arthrospira platensis FACHB-439]MBD2708885.1 DNA double-strand break repair nuclease NurA [Arthrospira platensis FACHB-835]MDT9308953.1 DNA double-strand break repair nuclease NurA [Limn